MFLQNDKKQKRWWLFCLRTFEFPRMFWPLISIFILIHLEGGLRLNFVKESNCIVFFTVIDLSLFSDKTVFGYLHKFSKYYVVNNSLKMTFWSNKEDPKISVDLYKYNFQFTLSETKEHFRTFLHFELHSKTKLIRFGHFWSPFIEIS